ncbi:hypothetical protein [Roseomonas sp. KE2513]|nr:hypothetical protein [Roseomonas sp. KE2513]
MTSRIPGYSTALATGEVPRAGELILFFALRLAPSTGEAQII